MNIDIDIDSDELAEAVTESRHFDQAVKGCFDGYDLSDAVEEGIDNHDFTRIVEDALTDIGHIIDQARITGMEARLDALVARVTDLETTNKRLATILTTYAPQVPVPHGADAGIECQVPTCTTPIY